MSFTARPSRFGAAMSLFAGMVAVGALAGIPAASAAAAAGLLSLVGGTLRDHPRLRSLGAAGMLAGLLIAGAFGATAQPLVVATVAGVVAWDAADNAASLGGQLGAAAGTIRAELTHTAATTVVATTAGGVAFIAFRLVEAQRPLAAVVLLLVGATALAAALR